LSELETFWQFFILTEGCSGGKYKPSKLKSGESHEVGKAEVEIRPSS